MRCVSRAQWAMASVVLFLVLSLSCGGEDSELAPTREEEQEPLACSAYAVSDCPTNRCDRAVAHRLGATGDCYQREAEEVLCVEKDHLAGGAEMYLRDPSGTCWFFSGTWDVAGWMPDDPACPRQPTPRHCP